MHRVRRIFKQFQEDPTVTVTHEVIVASAGTSQLKLIHGDKGLRLKFTGGPIYDADVDLLDLLKEARKSFDKRQMTNKLADIFELMANDMYIPLMQREYGNGEIMIQPYIEGTNIGISITASYETDPKIIGEYLNEQIPLVPGPYVHKTLRRFTSENEMGVFYFDLVLKSKSNSSVYLEICLCMAFNPTFVSKDILGFVQNPPCSKCPPGDLPQGHEIESSSEEESSAEESSSEEESDGDDDPYFGRGSKKPTKSHMTTRQMALPFTATRLKNIDHQQTKSLTGLTEKYNVSESTCTHRKNPLSWSGWLESHYLFWSASVVGTVVSLANVHRIPVLTIRQ